MRPRKTRVKCSILKPRLLAKNSSGLRTRLNLTSEDAHTPTRGIPFATTLPLSGLPNDSWTSSFFSPRLQIIWRYPFWQHDHYYSSMDFLPFTGCVVIMPFSSPPIKKLMPSWAVFAILCATMCYLLSSYSPLRAVPPAKKSLIVFNNSFYGAEHIVHVQTCTAWNLLECSGVRPNSYPSGKIAFFMYGLNLQERFPRDLNLATSKIGALQV